MSTDSRYPYTYACDFIRAIAGYGEGGTKLSRADASQLRYEIANAIGVDDKELAGKLADQYLARQGELSERAAKELVPHLAYR